jgi:hypothetical protein
MTSEQRISAFIQLGIEIRNTFRSETAQNNIRQQQLLQISERMHHSNGWFTFENTKLALFGISSMLEESKQRAEEEFGVDRFLNEILNLVATYRLEQESSFWSSDR